MWAPWAQNSERTIAVLNYPSVISFSSLTSVPTHTAHRQTIMEDPFIREHIEDLLRNIRTQVLVKLIRPYTRVRIIFISQVSYLCCERGRRRCRVRKGREGKGREGKGREGKGRVG